MNKHDNADNLDALLRHTVRTAPIPELPAHFAQQIAQQAGDYSEQAGLEMWLIRLFVGLGIIAAVAFAIIVTDAAGQLVANLLYGAPWPLLLAAAGVFAAIKLLELKAHLAGNVNSISVDKV